jgi:hypothetical protein
VERNFASLLTSRKKQEPFWKILRYLNFPNITPPPLDAKNNSLFSPGGLYSSYLFCRKSWLCIRKQKTCI